MGKLSASGQRHAARAREAKEITTFIGKRLRQRREESGLSQNELAKLIGASFAEVADLERGAGEIQASRLFNVSKVLDVPMAFFFEEPESSLQHDATMDTFIKKIIDQVAEELPRILEARRNEITETQIREYLPLLLPPEPMEEAIRAIGRDNAHLRAQFLKEYACLSSAEVHGRAGAQSTNKALTANRWQKQRQVLALPLNGRYVYPAFQFRDGRPHPTISKILAVLGDALSPWQIAFWLVAGNSWLGGRRPFECLGTPEELVGAARRELQDPPS